jgi:endonuclease IV
MNLLKMCVDTCHIFTSGEESLSYVRRSLPLTKLIHFNDIDALVGEGHIGLATMTEIAAVAHQKAIPMVIE